MANTSNPFGLRPVKDASNRPWSGGGRMYYVGTGETANLYIGDAVIISGTGDTAGVPAVVKATVGSGNRITGAIVGWVPDANIIANGYRAGSTAAYALVSDDPNQLYEIQATTAAVTDIGANINLAAATGSRITQSVGYADGATIGTTATKQLRIKGVVQRADNETGAYTKLHVTINYPTEAGNSTGTGV